MFATIEVIGATVDTIVSVSSAAAGVLPSDPPQAVRVVPVSRAGSARRSRVRCMPSRY
jgi:hypothetical protein